MASFTTGTTGQAAGSSAARPPRKHGPPRPPGPRGLRAPPSARMRFLLLLGTISCKLDTGNLSLHSTPF
jgi:hypothetical protein